MKEKGMIWVAALDAVRKQLATLGAQIAAEIRPILPSQWPQHRYSLETPSGQFVEDTAVVSSNEHPGQQVRVPDWQIAPGADPIGFADLEGEKAYAMLHSEVVNANLQWCYDHFTFDISQVFKRFGTRYDRGFEGGKFPRDEWKAGSCDVDLWQAARVSVANNVYAILQEFARWNDENVTSGITSFNWLVTKLVPGDLIPGPGQEMAFASMPIILEDLHPVTWDERPAYQRISGSPGVGPDMTVWTANGLTIAFTLSRFGYLLERLEKAAFAKEVFDQCFTLWRTGSQTRRRDSYE